METETRALDSGVIESTPTKAEKKRDYTASKKWLLAPAMLWLCIFLLLPLLIMLVYSFGTMTGATMSLFTEFTTEHYVRLIHNPLYKPQVRRDQIFAMVHDLNPFHIED